MHLLQGYNCLDEFHLFVLWFRNELSLKSDSNHVKHTTHMLFQDGGFCIVYEG